MEPVSSSPPSIITLNDESSKYCLVPHRAWFAKIDTKRNIPTNMLYVSTLVNFLLGFIYLGSAAGFNIILGSSGIFYCKCQPRLFTTFFFF